MASFPNLDLPACVDNSTGLGPSPGNHSGTTDQFKGMPGRPFSKCDHVGRVGVWRGARQRRPKRMPRSKKAARTQADKGKPATSAGGAGLGNPEIRINPGKEVALGEETSEPTEPTACVTAGSSPFASREPSFTQFQWEILDRLRRIVVACERMPAKQNAEHSRSMSHAAAKEESSTPRQAVREATPTRTARSNPFVSREPSFTQFQKEILDRLRRTLEACERMPSERNAETLSPSLSQAAAKKVRDETKKKGAV
ncbi:hypothetical protein AAVH_05902 [Aphelenchoides avenae]|nr:hypothetical protein AAVH_05902 [Aphelenchus avenae]